jgi:hypothetical protein
MINLKPCPFCGSKASIVENITGTYHVSCNDRKCKCLMVAGMPVWRNTPEEAADIWNRRSVAKKTKVENLKHLIDLVSLNPDLPVLPIVDADCVVSDDYGYWLASIGSVEVTKILDDINYCKDGKFYREDDFDEIVEDLVSESDDPLDEEEAEDIVKNYPWRKVILVYIIPG